MKTTLTFLIAIICCSTLAQDKEYNVSVTLKKYPEKAMAYLYMYGSGESASDSALIENGSFGFKGKIDEPRPASIMIREKVGKYDERQHISFYIEPGNLVFNSKSFLKNADITGSPSTIEKQKLDKVLGPMGLGGGMNDQVKIVKVTGTTVVRSTSGSLPPTGMSSGNTTKTTSTMNVADAPLEVQQAIAARFEEAKTKATNFIKSNPKSFVSLYTLYTLQRTGKLSFTEHYELIKVLDPVLMESNAAKAFYNR